MDRHAKPPGRWAHPAGSEIRSWLNNPKSNSSPDLFQLARPTVAVEPGRLHGWQAVARRADRVVLRHCYANALLSIATREADRLAVERGWERTA